MVVLLGIVYKLYGGLFWIQAVFYGVGAAVIGIIVMSSYKLTLKSIGKFNLTSFKTNWLLWLFFIVAVVITLVTQQEQVLLFVLAGLIYMFVKAPPKWFNGKTANSIVLLQMGFWSYDNSTLMKIAIFFAEAGAFVFGSGLAIVPFLHSGVVVENQWLTEHQFVDAVAVAMITPGSGCYYCRFYWLFSCRFSGCFSCCFSYVFTLLFIYNSISPIL